jgi:hypothetical protein
MALRYTQPLTEMSTRNLLGVKSGRSVRLTALPQSVSRLARKCWSLDVSHSCGPQLSFTEIDLLLYSSYSMGDVWRQNYFLFSSPQKLVILAKIRVCVQKQIIWLLPCVIITIYRFHYVKLIRLTVENSTKIFTVPTSGCGLTDPNDPSLTRYSPCGTLWNHNFTEHARCERVGVAVTVFAKSSVRDPVPDPLLRKSGSTGNRSRDLWIFSQELWPLDQRGSHPSLIMLTNSIELGPSWESKSRWATEEFNNFDESRRFITIFTKVCHWFLSWARWIQSVTPHPVTLRSVFLMLSFNLHPGLPNGLLHSDFPTRTRYPLSFLFHACWGGYVDLRGMK